MGFCMASLNPEWLAERAPGCWQVLCQVLEGMITFPPRPWHILLQLSETASAHIC